MRKYYFRKNDSDFQKWCRHYVKEALSFIAYADKTYRGIYRLFESGDYHEALIIARQHQVLMASLTDDQRIYFEQSLVGDLRKHDSKSHAIHRVIYENWCQICFPQNKSRIKTIDKFLIGKTLMELRQQKELSASNVADLLNINYATLKAYESGERLVRADVLYGLSQIYDTSIDKIIEKSMPVAIEYKGEN